MLPLRAFLKDQSWPCAIVAHRGAWHHAPENSTLAITQAAERGYEFVELDVQQSWDGTLFCLHDRTLDRMTNTSGAAAPRLWHDLKGLRLKQGMGADAALTDERIVSFADALVAAKDRVYLDLDMKFSDQVAPIVAAVKAAGMAEQVNLKRDVNCRADYDSLHALEQSTGLIVKPILHVDQASVSQICDLISHAHFPMIEVLYSDFETLLKVAAVCKAVGTEVFVNTLDPVPFCPKKDTKALTDPDAVWGDLTRAHIRLIQTDEPAALSTFLKPAS
jgi:glycerophosphoryl diester phosphodiesterase